MSNYSWWMISNSKLIRQVFLWFQIKITFEMVDTRVWQNRYFLLARVHRCIALDWTSNNAHSHMSSALDYIDKVIILFCKQQHIDKESPQQNPDHLSCEWILVCITLFIYKPAFFYTSLECLTSHTKACCQQRELPCTQQPHYIISALSPPDTIWKQRSDRYHGCIIVDNNILWNSKWSMAESIMRTIRYDNLIP